MDRYIQLTGKVKVYINCTKICAVTPTLSGCTVHMDNGDAIQVKESHKVVIHKIFAII
ncbi:hypothetical protein [Pedobacter sp. MC2016-24]|uniref:hypothetical protein n=1 Tax=Pedobacter sp. MC2016-24 TaxID=2780090 RepID=UPI00187F6EF2|nr:hypothetical protein [Pedobacter sp. MC2016-24]MBE9602786.1 hypothetical protein [Pedobacter sp. MC2016-24]